MTDSGQVEGEAAQLLYRGAIDWRQVDAYRQEAEAVLAGSPGDRLALYVLAAIAEFAGDMSRMQACLERSGLPIGMDYDDYALPVHQRVADDFLTGRPGRTGMRPRFIVSLPKSASSYVSACIAEVCALPRVRVSKGAFTQARVIPSWLRNFNRAGGVLHDHFPLSPENRESLLQAPPERMLLLLRDPVTATLSFCDHVLVEPVDKFHGRAVGEADLAYLRGLPAEAARGALFQKLLPRMADWIEAWLAFAHDVPKPIRIGIVLYEEAVRDMPGAMSRMEHFFDERRDFFPPGDAARAVQLGGILDRLRGQAVSTLTARLGQRQVVLDQAGEELVWRVRHSHRHLCQVYDLGRYLT